jgi:CheY-like chemotaxis protein
MAHLESLVVLDPSPRSRAALVFGFERAGYSVYATGESADALAMAQTRVPQLLVAAAERHGHDGPSAFEVIGRLRDEPATRELPIVVLGERDARQEALRVGADEFVSRPAFIRDVVTLAKLAVAVRQDGDDAGVVGLVEDYGLFFLTRALAVAGRSGVIELERGRRTGEVDLSKGEVVAARVGRMSGVAAFHQLLLWPEASLQLRFESPTGERKINVPIDELLAGGARFGCDFEKLASRIGGPRAIFRQTPTRAAGARAQIPTEVLALLKLYDGKRLLVDIVEDSPFKPFDTVKITHRLSELNAIARVDASTAESPLTAQLAVRDWLLGAPPAGEEPRSTVTDAGRRAAEAYAAEEARRASPPPTDDLFGETERHPRVDLPEPVEPAASHAEAAVPVPPPVENPAAHEPAPVEKPAEAPKPAPEARRGKKKHKGQPVEKPAAHADPPARRDPTPARFDEFDESFFAREAELQSAPDNFDDLESSPKRKIPPKRRWFLFGSGAPDSKKR